MEVLPSRQNRPFFVTAYIYYVELRRSLIGPSSSLDIMPLSTLKAVGIPQERIVKQPVEVLGFLEAAHLSIFVTLTSTWALGLSKCNSIQCYWCVDLLLVAAGVTLDPQAQKLSSLCTINAWRPPGEVIRFMSIHLDVNFSRTKPIS